MSSLEVKGSNEPAGQEARELETWSPGRSSLHLRTKLSFQEPHLLQTQICTQLKYSYHKYVSRRTDHYLGKLIRCMNK